MDAVPKSYVRQDEWLKFETIKGTQHVFTEYIGRDCNRALDSVQLACFNPLILNIDV